MPDPISYITKPMKVLNHSKGTAVAFRRRPSAISGMVSSRQDYMYFFDKDNNGVLGTGDVVVTFTGTSGCYSGTSKSAGPKQPRFCVRKVTAADIKRYGAKFRQEVSKARLFKGFMTRWAKTQSFAGKAVKKTTMTIYGAKRAVFGSLLNMPMARPGRTKTFTMFSLNAFHSGLMYALGLTDDSTKPNTQMSLYKTDYLFIDVK